MKKLKIKITKCGKDRWTKVNEGNLVFLGIKDKISSKSRYRGKSVFLLNKDKELFLTKMKENGIDCIVWTDEVNRSMYYSYPSFKRVNEDYSPVIINEKLINKTEHIDMFGY